MKLLLFTLGICVGISLVRILQWQVRRHELWVYNFPAVFGHRQRDWGCVSAITCTNPRPAHIR
jgi:hypothetical protein